MADKIKPREELLKVVETINENLRLTDMHIELASDERAKEMVDFLSRNFYPDETICKSLGVVIDECMREFLLSRFQDNLSLLLVSDVSCNIIGVQTIKVVPAHVQSLNLSSLQDEKFRMAFAFVHHKNEEMNVCKYYGVECAVHLINLAIHKDYRNKGLGSTLLKAVLLFAKNIGLEPACVTGDGTSKHAQKIFETLDFEAFHTVKFKEYEVNGEVVLKTRVIIKRASCMRKCYKYFGRLFQMK